MCVGFLLLILILAVVAHSKCNTALTMSTTQQENTLNLLVSLGVAALDDFHGCSLIPNELADSKAIGHQDSKCENLISSLIMDRDALRDERDQMKVNYVNLTKEMEVLQSQYNAMAVSRDALQEEVNRFNVSKKGKKCTDARNENLNGTVVSLL